MEHHTLCPTFVYESYGYKYLGSCQCDLIQKVREKLAQDIESEFVGDHEQICLCDAISRFAYLARGK